MHFQPTIDRTTFGNLAQTLAQGLGFIGDRTLPRLAEAYPGQPSGGRWIGVQAVPTECIRGTTSIALSRGINFQPLRGREPADWKTRWSRLTAAARNGVILPPVELIRAGGGYWVVDGHNRVALAKERGQLWIDADITELDLGSAERVPLLRGEVAVGGPAPEGMPRT